jgi:hypothetical protein
MPVFLKIDIQDITYQLSKKMFFFDTRVVRFSITAGFLIICHLRESAGEAGLMGPPQ